MEASERLAALLWPWRDGPRLSWRLLLAYAAAIGCPVLLGFIYKLYRHRKRWRKLGLPGPPHEFIFGHLRTFADHASSFKGKHIDYTAESISTSYGNGLVYLDLWPFALPVCIISDPSIADQIVRVDNLPKCLGAMKVHFPIFGKESFALAASDEKGKENWSTVRKSIAPGFKKGHLERSWTEDIVQVSQDFVDTLKIRAKDGQTAVMADYLVEATLDLILRVTIGSYDKQLSNQLLSVLNSQLEHASKTGVVNALFSTLTPLNQIGEKRRARQMYDLLAPKVQQHIDDSKQSDLLNKEKIDVLDWALANHPEFGVSTLIDQIKTFVLAGHDTASSTLAWIYYHLSQQPEVLQRLREEHDNVFAGKDSIGREGGYIAKDPTILNEMKYTLAVMREALRLYPPAAAVRQADSELYVVEHMGTNYSVAGCMLWVNHWCLHRSKATWGEDADMFKPERWIDDQGNVMAPPMAWQPFSKDESGDEYLRILPEAHFSRDPSTSEELHRHGVRLDGTENHPCYDGEFIKVRLFDFEYAGEGEPYQTFRLTAQPNNGIPMRIRLVSEKKL